MDRFDLPIKSVPRLDVDLRHRIGAIGLEVKFSVAKPWTILFGPSGSGKTTILRAITGLIRPDSARITSTAVDFRGEESNQTLVDSKAGRFIDCHRRHVPMAPQKPSLFPHMTVQQQVGYGMHMMARYLRDEGFEMAECDQKTWEILELFRIRDLAEKLPRALSGGEAQRVNLARAAASACRLLLLDEPFSGLDMTLQSDILRDLQNWAAERNLCVLSVTHDVAEAFQLGAEVIKLADGRVVAQGPVERVLAQERVRLLAQLNP